MHNPTDKIAHTTAFVTPVVENWLEREKVQWVHPMKDRSDDPRSYISLQEKERLTERETQRERVKEREKIKTDRRETEKWAVLVCNDIVHLILD